MYNPPEIEEIHIEEVELDAESLLLPYCKSHANGGGCY